MPLQARPLTRLLNVHRAPSTRTLTTSRAPWQQSNADAKRENLLDKDGINTTSTEYSQTGGGDADAAHSHQAFEPRNTDPGAQVAGMQREKGDASPATVSPGNREVNQDAAKMGSGGAADPSGGQRSGGLKPGSTAKGGGTK